MISRLVVRLSSNLAVALLAPQGPASAVSEPSIAPAVAVRAATGVPARGESDFRPREAERTALAVPRLALAGWEPTDLEALLATAVEGPASDDDEERVLPRRRPLLSAGEKRGLILGTALLLATDRTLLGWFDPDLGEPGRSGDGTGQMVSRLGTGLPILLAVALPGAVDGKYGRRTSALAAMAIVNATLVTEGTKFLTGRARPFEAGGSLRFHGPASGYTSFPSGHTSAAFAVATVLGERYRKYRIPLYLLATAVGWARMNSARHYPADVFVGAGVGIVSGRYVLERGARLWSIRF